MSKIILGLTGEMVSGKGTVAKYICEKYGANASSYRFSTILRDILNRVHVEQTRENLQRVSEVMRKNFGEDLMARAMALDVQKDTRQIVVIDGIRRLPDIKYLQELSEFKLVYLEADVEERYKRLIIRNENADDSTKTLEQFKSDLEAEAESQIRGLKKDANYVIDNNGSLDELYAQVDRIISENV